eukprot:Partr_v1_DN24976_c0_g1_i1_m45516 putative RAD1 homolog (S. pombe)
MTVSSPSATSADAFMATVDDVRVLASILRPIAFADSLMQCTASPAGLEFSTQKAKSIQVHTFLPRVHLRDFELISLSPASGSATDTAGSTSGQVSFWIDPVLLLECLNIYGNASGLSSDKSTKHNVQLTAMRMELIDSKLEVVLDDEGVITRCRLDIYEEPDTLPLFFDSDSLAGKVIMKAASLAAALEQLSQNLASVELAFHPASDTVGPASKFTISASGDSGMVDIAFDSKSDIIEYFHCSHPLPVSRRYDISGLKLERAVMSASKVSIRLNDVGVMAMQLMVSMNRPHQFAFVEFIFSCMLE